MPRDSLVLEYLKFYVKYPMHKHYVVTAELATQEVLQTILNPYASTAKIEFLSLARAATGWADYGENVALGCTYLFSTSDTDRGVAAQLGNRLRHPNAPKFILLEDEDGSNFSD